MNLALALEGRAVADAEAKPLVAIADMLATLPEPEIDETFAAALEARLLTEGLPQQIAPAAPRLTVVKPAPAIEPAAEPIAPVVTLPKRRFVVRRTLAAAIAAAMLFGAVPVLASSALPGSSLYGAKLAIEQIGLWAFGGPVADGFTKVSHAQRRVSEAAQLAELGADPGLIAATLARADGLLREGKQLVLDNTSDPAELSRLATLARRAETGIRSIATDDPQARLAAATVVDTTRQIQSEVAAALGVSQASPVNVTAAASVPASEEPTTSAAEPKSDATTSAPTVTTPKPQGGPSVDDPTQGGEGKEQRTFEGCKIIGSGDGLGDLGAFATRLTCK